VGVWGGVCGGGGWGGGGGGRVVGGGGVGVEGGWTAGNFSSVVAKRAGSGPGEGEEFILKEAKRGGGVWLTANVGRPEKGFIRV